MIDLDAYGSPWNQVVAIMGNRTRHTGTLVFYTLIRSVLGRAATSLLVSHDFTATMVRKAPILASSWGYRAWCNALVRYGVKEITEILVPRGVGVHGDKRYGLFRIPEVA